MEPLRDDWNAALSTASRQRAPRRRRPGVQHRHRGQLPQGRRVLPQIEAVLAALEWDGWVSQTEGGAGFVLREAA